MNCVDHHCSATGAGRIAIDLSQFFQDFKKYCIVYLDYDNMKTVKDLKNYIIGTFKLEKDFILMLDDCLLLENDNLRVLRNNDLVW